MNSSTTTPVPSLRLGSRLLSDAYADNGMVLLRAGSYVTSRQQLHRLLQDDVRFGQISADALRVDVETERLIDAVEALRRRNPDIPEENLIRAAAMKCDAIRDITQVFYRIASSGAVDLSLAKQSVKSIISELAHNKDSILRLVQVKNTDSYTFTHSVNVSILAMCLVLGTSYEESIEDVGTGALLHDIGKVRIPGWVFRKNGPLDEAEFRVIREHPTLGARLLSASGHGMGIVAACVLDHHEKLTGDGYPFGKSRSEIGPFAQITGVADIYDALTTKRPFRQALQPQQALHVMRERMGRELDENLLARFSNLVGFLSDSRGNEK